MTDIGSDIVFGVVVRHENCRRRTEKHWRIRAAPSIMMAIRKCIAAT